jgi:hypothetical protein
MILLPGVQVACQALLRWSVSAAKPWVIGNGQIHFDSALLHNDIWRKSAADPDKAGTPAWVEETPSLWYPTDGPA